MPKLLLVPRRLWSLEQSTGVLCRFRKTRTGRGDGPGAWMVSGQMPATSAAHGKSTDGQAALVDRIVLADMFECFEDICLAGELEGIAITAVRMKNKSVRGGEFANGALPIGKKFQLAQMI